MSRVRDRDTAALAKRGLARLDSDWLRRWSAARLWPPILVWVAVTGLFGVIGIGFSKAGYPGGITHRFFYAHDLRVAVVIAGLLAMSSFAAGIFRWAPTMSARTVLAAALLATAFAWAGAQFIYHGYALSMDEFMATFDARIFASGQLAAPTPEGWRPFTAALAPVFALPVPGDAYWVSAYLPVNAAFLGIASLVGAQSLMNPLWAGISVLAVFAIGRRLWPERREPAILAALLLATSPQLLITAMTPYAMNAHLALNLVWLLLVLRGGLLGHGAAAGVAFLATGLHQLIFHPLFAAPFVLELWLARRWKPALWHTCVYVAVAAFWVSYHPLLLSILESPATAASTSGAGGTIALALQLLRDFKPAGLGLMSENLVRLFTWQSLLAAPLALFALIPALRANGTLRALAVGTILTTVTMFVLLPYQGHGWGYRYLHGFLGSICLLAAYGWLCLSAGATPAAIRAQRVAFAAALAATVLILIPVRAWQAESFVRPYAVAERRIRAMQADVVIVDDSKIQFGVDLVRNDPLFQRRPIILAASALTPIQRHRVERLGSTAVFTENDARSAGLVVLTRTRQAPSPQRTTPTAAGQRQPSRGGAHGSPTR